MYVTRESQSGVGSAVAYCFAPSLRYHFTSGLLRVSHSHMADSFGAPTAQLGNGEEMEDGKYIPALARDGRAARFHF